MIIEQVKQMMPEQAEMVEQSIDQLMASGMLKMEMNMTHNYEFLPNGWAKTITGEMKQNTMGQVIESTIKTELVGE